VLANARYLKGAYWPMRVILKERSDWGIVSKLQTGGSWAASQPHPPREKSGVPSVQFNAPRTRRNSRPGVVVKGERFDECHEWGSGQYSLLLTGRPDRSQKQSGALPV